MFIGDVTKEPAADGAHQKACGEDACRLQKLCGAVVRGEKDMRKVERTKGVDVEIKPLDEVARRGTDNRPDTSAGIAGSQ